MNKIMRKFINLIGKRFGKLTVIKYVGKINMANLFIYVNVIVTKKR